MEENAKSVPVPAGRWLTLIVAAVILAEGIWAMLVSLTQSLLVPLLARITGGDSQSALYLGKGDVNIPDLFGSVLQLCLAGILFLIIKSWPAKGNRVKTSRVVKANKPVSPVPATPKPAIQTAQAAQAAVASAAPATAAAVPPQAAQPSVRPQSAPKPAKPEKPKEVYYNLVGEPISPDEDE